MSNWFSWLTGYFYRQGPNETISTPMTSTVSIYNVNHSSTLDNSTYSPSLWIAVLMGCTGEGTPYYYCMVPHVIAPAFCGAATGSFIIYRMWRRRLLSAYNIELARREAILAATAAPSPQIHQINSDSDTFELRRPEVSEIIIHRYHNNKRHQSTSTAELNNNDTNANESSEGYDSSISDDYHECDEIGSIPGTSESHEAEGESVSIVTAGYEDSHPVMTDFEWDFSDEHESFDWDFSDEHESFDWDFTDVGDDFKWTFGEFPSTYKEYSRLRHILEIRRSLATLNAMTSSSVVVTYQNVGPLFTSDSSTNINNAGTTSNDIGAGAVPDEYDPFNLSTPAPSTLLPPVPLSSSLTIEQLYRVRSSQLLRNRASTMPLSSPSSISIATTSSGSDNDSEELFILATHDSRQKQQESSLMAIQRYVKPTTTISASTSTTELSSSSTLCTSSPGLNPVSATTTLFQRSVSTSSTASSPLQASPQAICSLQAIIFQPNNSPPIPSTSAAAYSCPPSPTQLVEITQIEEVDDNDEVQELFKTQYMSNAFTADYEDDYEDDSGLLARDKSNNNLQRTIISEFDPIVVLHQFARSTSLPCCEPHGLKIESILRMAGIRYKLVFDCDVGSIMGPWIDCDSKRVFGSAACERFLEDKFFDKLIHFAISDSLEINAPVKAWLVKMLAEKHLYWGIILWKWSVEELNEETLTLLASGQSPSEIFSTEDREHFIKYSYWVEHFGMLSLETLVQELDKDLFVLSQELENQTYFVNNEISIVDCTVFSVLAQMVWTNSGSNLPVYIRKYPNLLDFCYHMRSTIWPDWFELRDELTKYALEPKQAVTNFQNIMDKTVTPQESLTDLEAARYISPGESSSMVAVCVSSSEVESSVPPTRSSSLTSIPPRNTYSFTPLHSSVTFLPPPRSTPRFLFSSPYGVSTSSIPIANRRRRSMSRLSSSSNSSTTAIPESTDELSSVGSSGVETDNQLAVSSLSRTSSIYEIHSTPALTHFENVVLEEMSNNLTNSIARVTANIHSLSEFRRNFERRWKRNKQLLNN